MKSSGISTSISARRDVCSFTTITISPASTHSSGPANLRGSAMMKRSYRKPIAKHKRLRLELACMN
nr:MAG TPA: hypothetical protein [Caudoviricetes sp.]